MKFILMALMLTGCVTTFSGYEIEQCLSACGEVGVQDMCRNNHNGEMGCICLDGVTVVFPKNWEPVYEFSTGMERTY